MTMDTLFRANNGSGISLEILRHKFQNNSSILPVAIGTVALILFFSFMSPQKDSREPPYIYPKIPYFGHVFSLLSDGARHFTNLDREYHHGLYTLPVLPVPLLRSKMYVAGSAEWSTAVQKHSSTIDLYSLSTRALDTLMGLNKESMAIITRNLHGDKKKTQDNLLFVLKDIMLRGLAPGKDLDELNHNLLKLQEPLFNGLARDGKPEKLMLWAWARQNISVISMAAAYGEENPTSLDPSLVDDFWTFDAMAGWLMMPLPQVFVRWAHLARWRFINGFINYAKTEGYKRASTLIQNRAKAALGQGLEIGQYGQLESNFAPGLLSNTVPATFWLICRMFEDQELLAALRGEIDKCIVKDGDKHTINVVQLLSQCPLYSSVFMETLRVTSPLNTYRYIREDTVITNNQTKESYLLKKDRLIQLASTVLHAKPDIWGEDPDSFNPRRFIPVVKRARAGGGLEGKAIDPAAPFRDSTGKMHAGSFRPFGGGVHLCPGRFFAQTGIQAGAAMFISAFNMESEPGKFVTPQVKNAKGFMFLSIIKPNEDVEVEITRRPGFETAEWVFDLHN